jgi:hypothetical protein
MEKYYILTFINTHSAISTENTLKEFKVKNVVMPTPTFITKSCGLSIKIDYENIELIQDMISKDKIKVKGIYLKEGTGYSTFME